MKYLYLLFPFIVWTISQTIKFIVRITHKKMPNHLQKPSWTYVWAGGAPSTHTAILTSGLVLVWNSYKFSPIFTFALIVTILWLYDIANRHKRYEVMNSYFINSEDLKQSVTDGHLLDLAGHTWKELAWGALLGITLGLLAVNFVFN